MWVARQGLVVVGGEGEGIGRAGHTAVCGTCRLPCNRGASNSHVQQQVLAVMKVCTVNDRGCVKQFL
jgi:hypothetical protein